jgi:hypothetical protein
METREKFQTTHSELGKEILSRLADDVKNKKARDDNTCINDMRSRQVQQKIQPLSKEKTVLRMRRTTEIQWPEF